MLRLRRVALLIIFLSFSLVHTKGYAQTVRVATEQAVPRLGSSVPAGEGVVVPAGLG